SASPPLSLSGAEGRAALSDRRATRPPCSGSRASTESARGAGRTLSVRRHAAADRTRDRGALMEPSGRNRRQLVANRLAPVTAQTSHFATVGKPRQRFKTAW